jgi:predicted AlkP superfamily phosphohydrolase/phosphomutase
MTSVITRPRILCLILLSAAVVGCPLGCRSGGLPDDVRERPERVVVVSYDGVGADLLDRWLADGTASDPGGLAGLADEGLRVRRLRPVDPTLTAVVHATLATAALPAATGIVSNRFLPPGAPVDRPVSGFDAPWEAPPVWSLARRAGRRVGILLWPGSDARSLERMGDFGIWWPIRPLASSEVLELDPERAGAAPDLPSADGVTTLAWRVEIALPGAEPATTALEVAVADLAPDGRQRFDTVAFRAVGDDAWELRDDRGWYRLDLEALGPGDLGAGRYAAWCKVLHLDRWRGSVRLLRGGAWRLLGYPEEFAESLEAAIGPWPGPPDDALLEAWWLDAAVGIDLDAWLEQAERLDRWLDDALAWVVANERFDLLLSYHPLADEYQHTSLIVRPGQWAFSPGKAVAAREGLKRVGRRIDASVAHAWSPLDAERDVLVVLSDHGQLPLEREVRLVRLLADHGLLEVESGPAGEPVAGRSSRVVATMEAACAHVYLNRVGLRPGGTVGPDEAGALLRQVARLLADLEEDGEPLVERVVTRSEAAALGLDHPASGDLVAFLAPGSQWSPSLDGPVVAPTASNGQHGHLSQHDGMCGILLARGAGIRRATSDEIGAVEAGAWIRSLVGLPPS